MLDRGATAPATASARAPVRLAIIISHPIQYFSPWFRQLAANPALDLTVIYLRHLAPAQQGVGFDAAFTWDVPLLEGYRSVNLKTSPGGAGIASGLRRLSAALRDARAQVVLVTGWQEPLLALAAPFARLSGYSVLMRGESNALRTRGLMPRALHRLLLSCVHAVLCIGQANRAFYVESGVAPARLFGGAYFVENERFLALASEHARDAEALRAAESIPDVSVVFAFSGKHVAFKRPDLLVEAAGRLVAEGLPIHLRFAGSGELTESLRERCAAANVPASFTGFLNQSEMWRAYVGADVFVLPSTNRETWGLVVNEAMLFGLPAIVSEQVGCGPDLVLDGATGWVFKGDADGLASAMREAVRQRARLPAMGARARERVRELYSMDVATAGLLDALKSLQR